MTQGTNYLYNQLQSLDSLNAQYALHRQAYVL
jgi:hypothetical protein